MDAVLGRDEVCRQDVGRMAQLGRFGEEFTFYGCVFFERGKRKYCMSEQPEQLFDYRQKWLLKGRVVTPIETYSKRLMLPSGLREGLKQAVRVEFAKTMQNTYPVTFFNFITSYSILEPNDTAYEPLVALQKKWSGAFDIDHLHLYSNLVEEAYLRKRLTMQSYWQLRQWTNHLWDQPGLSDAPREQEIRKFSAFLYKDDTGVLKLESGIPKYKVLLKKELHDLNGQITTPVFTKSCWFKDITQLRDARKNFEIQSQMYLSGAYWQVVQQLRELPSTLANSNFEEQIDELCQKVSPAAVQAAKWYGLLWG